MERRKKDIIELTRISVEDYRSSRKLPLLLVADNVRSMMNVGSFLRTADAFSLASVELCGISGCPPHPEVSKTALGAENSVLWHHHDSSLQCCQDLQQQGWKILALEQAHHSVALQDFKPKEGEKYAVVVGNEVEGVDQRIVDMADAVLEIPQSGTKHSLNVSVSAGIALWQIVAGMLEMEESKNLNN